MSDIKNLTTYKDGKMTAILVDGGFYRRRAYACKGNLSPEERAVELDNYCRRHLSERINNELVQHDLYRIFYYDCKPTDKVVYHPFLKEQIDLKKSDTYKWTNDFYNCLSNKRKFALRFGKLQDSFMYFDLKEPALRNLLNGKRKIDELTKDDFSLSVEQKGVDMKIGLDIASLAYKKQVDQIILISGDSDFISAAKLARREGVDFILDPLGANVKEELLEHIDGLRTCDDCYNKSKTKN